MNLAGLGIVFARGRGVAALERALEEGWRPPTPVAVRGLPPPGAAAYVVAPETLTDKVLLAQARRADRCVKMAVLAAGDALQDAGPCTAPVPARLGVIVSSALGPHVTTFAFLDGLLEFGDAAASPTVFSHAIHGAAASYIAMTVKARGPSLTVTDFQAGFHRAVEIAGSWLAEDRCDAVLVGAVEEVGAVLSAVCARLLRPAADGRIKPFAFAPVPEAVPGEGSVFFLLTRETDGQSYARLAVGDRLSPAGACDLQLCDACGLARDESAWRAALAPDCPAAGYAPLFGSTFASAAFHVATAALMLKRQKRYACPDAFNPHGCALVRETAPAALQSVACLSLDCAGRSDVLHLAAVGRDS